MPTKSLKFKHTLKLIREFTIEIYEIDVEIKKTTDNITLPFTTIPSIDYSIEAMIISEIGDFRRFSSPNNILAMRNYPIKTS